MATADVINLLGVPWLLPSQILSGIYLKPTDSAHADLEDKHDSYYKKPRLWYISQLLELNIKERIHYSEIYSQVLQFMWLEVLYQRRKVQRHRGNQNEFNRKSFKRKHSKNGRVRNRTGDLSHAKGARYQLRHTPKTFVKVPSGI